MAFLGSIPGSSTPSTSIAGADSLTLLNDLEVKGRAPQTGYSRDLFGTAWTDAVDVEGGHNGCDSRNDQLNRDLVDTVIRPGTHDCVVESGTLHDPYSGDVIHFNRGDRTVDIDHMVALGDAWQKGAQAWDEQTRRNFANDPINLQATSASLNRQKGAADAATWLPPNKGYRCEYAQRIITVKHTYGLWVTPAERDALHRELSRCH